MANNPPISQRYSLLTILFAVTAFCLMWAGAIRCNFLAFDSVSDTGESVSFQLGVWYYSYWSLIFQASGTYILESCNVYPDYTTIDASWKAAQAFGIITFILGLIMLVLLCVFGCITGCGADTDFALTHVWEAPMYLLTAICQGLVLLLLSSNACNSNVLTGLGAGTAFSGVTFTDSCRISTGAKLVISATVFWFSAAVTSFLAHKAEKAEMAEDAGEADIQKVAEEGESNKVEEAELAEAEGGETDKPEMAVAAEAEGGEADKPEMAVTAEAEGGEADKPQQAVAAAEA